MMFLLRIRAAAAFAGLVLLAACTPTSDSIASLDANLAAHAVASESQAAAAPSGAVLVRGETASFLVHLDAGEGLLSVHAPSDVCGAGSLNVVDFQFVTTPSAIGQFIAVLKDSDERTSIYQASSFAEAGMVGSFGTAGIGGIVDFATFCAFLEGPNRIAEGDVGRVSTLSNASFAAHWTGTIQGVDGREMRLREIYQLGADARDPNNMGRVDGACLVRSPPPDTLA